MKNDSGKGYLSNLFILCSVFTSPGSSGSDSDFSYVCEKGGATRFVEVVRDPGFSCRVKYTKSSVTTFPWYARNEAGYCRLKAIKLIDKLGDTGWSCESTEDVIRVLNDQIERYGRYINSFNSVGKTCYFHPGEAQFGNLCGDARKESAIIYTCDTDVDNWNQHLAIFLELEAEPLVREVGSSGRRLVSSYHIDNERVVMKAEKITRAGDRDPVQHPLETTMVQCLYSAAFKWELIEK